ncbi:protein translocase subunit SecF [Patescibacteria group bacterium]|nr:protein translocase subunit SecF [Patescibacteria group bacterium]
MNIIKHKYLFIITGLAIVFVSLAITLIFGLRPGIDFTGGALTEVRFETLPEKTDVEGAVSAVISEQFSVRQSTSDEGNGYLISTRDLSSEESQALSEAVLGLGEGAEIVRYTSVGPVIGAELADKAVWAIGAVLILIIVYVAFAFAGIGKPVSSWIYGFMTIVVLGHDILVPIAAMSLLGYFIGAEADILFVTALLTILGFSVNDTIVIFDRVREKLKENRTEQKHTVKVVGGMDRVETTYTLTRPFGTLVEEAINETMARSINTSLTVLFALGALYLFGGEVTETFVLVLIVGVVAGAYSSIFIASPLLVVYQEWQAKRATTTVAKK